MPSTNTRVLKVKAGVGCCLLAAAQAGRIGEAILDGLTDLRADSNLALVPAILSPDGFTTLTEPRVIQFEVGKPIPTGGILLVTGIVLDTILKSIAKEEMNNVIRTIITGIEEVLSGEASDCAKCVRRRALGQDSPRQRVSLVGGGQINRRL
jgi:hypothetical protein